MRAARVAVVVPLLVTVALAGCTSGRTRPAPTTRTVVTGTQTVVTTRTVSPPTPTAAPATVHPLPPGASPRAGEKEQACPYIRTGLQLDPTTGPNMADLEGDHIYRVTLLTRYTPVGCRFYFYAPPYEAVADIRPFTYATATQARTAMIELASTGVQEETDRNFVTGLVGIRFRTRYFGPDGQQDWAFAFYKGRRMIAVYTQQDVSQDAVNIAAAIAAKF